jgi:nitroreductase
MERRENVDVFEALESRRAVRDFKAESTPDELLRKLVWAARRAPTAGNAPYRKLLLVNDRKVIDLVRCVSPGMFGSPSALILIFIDLQALKHRDDGGMQVSAKEYVFRLATYMAVSARESLREPPHYSPLRMMAISRLALLPKYAKCIEEDAFLLQMKRMIDQNKHLGLVSEEKFTDFLDQLVKEFTKELKRRAGLS